jgi:DNA-damage-inducible protein J
MATIQVHVDENTKIAIGSLFSSLGLDTSTAVEMFLTTSLERDGPNIQMYAMDWIW